MGSANQHVDGFTFVLLWILGLLFMRIPNDFLTVKLICFSLIICGAALCFVASQPKEWFLTH
jgi:hypothetical protein